jgi:hypothetical protein
MRRWTPAPTGIGDRGNIGTGNRNYTTARQRAIARNTLELRRRRLLERVYRLGARAVAEFVLELIRRGLIADEAELDSRLARYAAADPVILAAVGGDRMPPVPVHLASEAGP